MFVLAAAVCLCTAARAGSSDTNQKNAADDATATLGYLRVTKSGFLVRVPARRVRAVPYARVPLLAQTDSTFVIVSHGGHICAFPRKDDAGVESGWIEDDHVFFVAAVPAVQTDLALPAGAELPVVGQSPEAYVVLYPGTGQSGRLTVPWGMEGVTFHTVSREQERQMAELMEAKKESESALARAREKLAEAEARVRERERLLADLAVKERKLQRLEAKLAVIETSDVARVDTADLQALAPGATPGKAASPGAARRLGAMLAVQTVEAVLILLLLLKLREYRQQRAKRAGPSKVPAAAERQTPVSRPPPAGARALAAPVPDPKPIPASGPEREPMETPAAAAPADPAGSGELSGNVAEGNIVKVVQFLNGRSENGRLRLNKGETALGELVLRNGDIVAAEAGYQTGEAAAKTILLARDGKFKFSRETAPSEGVARNVNEQTEQLLAAAFKELGKA